MTDYMDKSKRKRTPNRFRRVALWAVLPIVLLIAGFMMLSPQIDAWLATDPFTPQCQFEQDRWFAIGYPASIGSFNSRFYEDFQARSDYTYLPSRWSPDGRYHLHVKDADVRTIAISTYDGTEIFSLSDPQLSYDGWYWSPNSRMILYSTNTQAISVLQVYKITDDVVTALDFSDFAASDFPPHWLALSKYGDVGMSPNQGWSTDGSYLMFSYENEIYVIDVEGDTLTRLSVNIPMSPFPIWWSDTAFYFVEDQILKSYDISTNDITDVTELSGEAKTVIAFGENIVAVYDENFSVSYYAKSQNLWTSIGTGLGFVQWLESKQTIIYVQDADNGTVDYYKLDVPTGETALLLNAPTYLNKLQFSSSGQNVIYLDESDDTRWIIQPITNIDESLTNTKSVTVDYPSLMNWFSHHGQDWLLVQESKPHLADKIYMTYVMHPETLSRCKVGLSDINLRLQPQA